MRGRMQGAALATALLMLLAAGPTWAGAGCNGTAALALHRQTPLSEARAYQPVNGTGGFSVFGANTVGARTISVGLGYMGEDAVCQELDDDFDLNTVWLALAYGITDRLQVGMDIPYTWFEADRADSSGQALDDLNFGVVYRVLDEAPGRPAVAVVGFVAAPTGDRSDGVGRNEWDLGTKVALSKTLPGGLLGHVSVGYTYAGRGSVDQNDQFTSGVALEWPVNRYVSLVAEGLADTNRRSGSDRNSDWVAETRAGFRVRYAGFLLSVAGRKGLTNDAPDWGMFALITYSHTLAPPVAAAPTPAVAAPPPGAPAAPAGPAAPAPVAPGVAPPAPPGAPPGPVAAVPPPALPPAIRSLLRDVHFEFDRYDLTAEARRSLEDLGQALKGTPGIAVVIEGHADERGTTEYNLSLGERRAQAAKDYLVSLGIDPGRINTVSYGEERPLDPGHDELAWALNRRAHFVVRIRQ